MYLAVGTRARGYIEQGITGGEQLHTKRMNNHLAVLLLDLRLCVSRVCASVAI